MRVLHELRDVVDRAHGDFVFVEERHVFSLCHFDNEVANDGVEFGGVLDALGIGFVARVFD